MSRHRSFKQRNASRINYMILQEQAEIEAQRLLDQNHDAMGVLSKQLDTMDVVTRATERAFTSFEQQAVQEVGEL